MWQKACCLTVAIVAFVSLVGCPSEEAKLESQLRYQGPTYAIEIDSLYGSEQGKDRRMLLVSIQGIVNRRGVVLWLRNQPGQSPGLKRWESDFPELRNLQELSYRECLEKLVNPANFNGAVIVDIKEPRTYNIATNLAALEDLLVVTERTLPDIRDFGVPVRHDLRGRFRSDKDAYAYNLALYDRCDKEMVLKTLPWDDRRNFHGPERARDFAIQNCYFCFTRPEEQMSPAEMSAFYRQNFQGTHTIFGFTEDENADVGGASEAGKVWLGVMLYQYNLSAFHKLQHDPDFHYEQPSTKPPPLEQKIYVSFILSDGDNLFFPLSIMRQWWDDPKRGNVPIGWTLPPKLLDLCPAVLQYYYGRASVNDYFLAGPSGFAYYRPNLFDHRTFPGLVAELTPRYLRELDLRIVWNMGDFLGFQMTAESELERMQNAYPELLGWFEGYGDPTDAHGLHPYDRHLPLFVKGKPSVPFSAWVPAGDKATERIADIRKFAADHPGRPLFVAVGMVQNTCNPTVVSEMIEELGDDYVAVRPDVLMQLLAVSNDREEVGVPAYRDDAPDATGTFKPVAEDSVIMLIGDLRDEGPPTPWLPTLESRIHVAGESGVDTVILVFRTSSVEESYVELDALLDLAAESGIGVVPKLGVTSQTFTKWIETTEAGSDPLPDYTDPAQLEHGIALLKRVIQHLEAFPNVLAYQIEWGHWGESWINAPFWNSPSSRRAFLEFLHGLSHEFDRFSESNIADWIDGDIMFHSTFLPDGDVRRDPINVAEFYWYQQWRDETTRQISWAFRGAASQVTDRPIAGFSYVINAMCYPYTAHRHLDIAFSDWTASVPESINKCCIDFLRDAYFPGLHLADYDFMSYLSMHRAEEAIAAMYSRGIVPSIFYPTWFDDNEGLELPVDDDIPNLVAYINKHKTKMSSVEHGDVLVVYGRDDIGVVNPQRTMSLPAASWPLTSVDPPGLLQTMFDAGLTIDIVDADVYSPSLGNEYDVVVVSVPSDSIDGEFQGRLSETQSRVIVAHPSFLVGIPTRASPTTVTSAILGMWNPLVLNGRNLRMQVRGNDPGATIEFQGKLSALGRMIDYQANHLFSYYEGDFDEVYAAARMNGYTAPVIARIGGIILFGLDMHIFDDAHRALCQEAFLQLVDDGAMWTGPAETDRDGDGVPDDEDYCPDYPGSKDTNGC